MSKKISLSVYALQRLYGDKGALDKAKELGCDAVDFSLEARDYRRECDKYSLSDEEIYKYYFEIGQYAKEIGVEIAQTHGRLKGFKLDESENKAVLVNARLDCLATAALGAPVTVMHSVTTCNVGPDFPAEKIREMNFDMFSNILPFAKEFNINIALETFGDAPNYGCVDFFGNPQELLDCYMRLRNETPYADYVSLCVDTGHCNKASRFGYPKPSDVIRMFKGHISTLHLNDNDTLTDQHKPPRTGCIDWIDVMAALKEINYDGVYNMELALDCFGKDLILDTAALSVKIMRDLLK